jgi:hypothetical protein
MPKKAVEPAAPVQEKTLEELRQQVSGAALSLSTAEQDYQKKRLSIAAQALTPELIDALTPDHEPNCQSTDENMDGANQYKVSPCSRCHLLNLRAGWHEIPIRFEVKVTVFKVT